MAPKYSIEYRQVNVNVGDCQIILLVDHEGGSTKLKERVIKYAVWIDGGDDGPLKWQNIRRNMRKIEDDYRPKGGFKLDAIVITHWDSDHFTGVLRLLEAELDEQAAKTKTGPLKVSFLKYNAAGDPDSILYIPYRPDLDSGLGPFNNMLLFSTPTVTGYGEFGFEDKPTDRTPGIRSRVCKYLADLSIKPKKSGAPKAMTVKDVPESRVIGRNLFTDYRPPKLDDVVDAGNPKELVDAHGVKYPGLYCVAANDRFLKGKTYDPSVKVTSKRDNSLKNRTSIICMVIHTDGTVSHYLAGDADAHLELSVMQWTGLTETSTIPSTAPSLQERVAIVKASHHGSTRSTPLKFCQMYKPIFFTVSAGDEFRHPTWEIMLYVYSYYISPLGLAINAGDGVPFHMYTTTFPYWTLPPTGTRTTKENLFANDNALMEATSSIKGREYATEYQQTINSFFDPSTISSNLVDKFINKDDMQKKDAESRDPAKRDPARELQSDWMRKQATRFLWEKCNLKGVLAGTLSSKTKAANFESNLSSIVFTSNDNDPPQVKEELIGADSSAGAMPPGTKRSNSVPPPDDTAPKKKPRGHELVTLPIMAHAAGGEDNNDAKFYLMSSIVDPPSSDRAVYVPAEWDAFVSTLSYGFIILAGGLDLTTKEIYLHEADEWQVWLASTIPQVQISVTGSVTGQSVTILHFSLTVSVSKPSQLAKLDLTFSPGYKVGPKNNSRFEPDTDLLRFDISPNSSLGSISLKDLCAFFDVSSNSIDFASDIVFGLIDDSSVWFSPLLGNYTAAVRLRGIADEMPPNTVSFLNKLSDLKLWDKTTPSKATVIAKTITTTVAWESPRMNTNNPEIILSFEFPSFITTISCGKDSYTLVIYWKEGVLKAMCKVLDNISGSSAVSDAFKDVLGKISSSFDILRFLVEVNCGDDPKLSLGKIGIDAQLKFNKPSSEEKDVVVMLSFVWPEFVFKGYLYVPNTSNDDWKKLLPYEEWLEVKPTIDPSNVASNLSLLDLIPGVKIGTPPQGIPLVISRAEIEVNSTSFFLQGVMNPVPPSSGSKVPSISFDRLDISLSFNWGPKKPHISGLYVAALINLHPGSPDHPQNPEYRGDSSFLFASVCYADEKWTLTGGVEDINFGDLLIFFNVDEQSQVVDVLGNVTIRSLFLKYEYGSKGESTKFQFDGSIQIAELQLDFAYIRDSDHWSIEAGLSAANECTVADIIESICGDESQGFDIPDFIGGVKLNVQHDPDSHQVYQDSPVYLNCSKPSSKDSPLVFVFRLTLGKIQLAFIQISSQQPERASADSVADTSPKRTKKRILMFRLGDFLPSFTIPVIGKLDNPVDGLEFIWVHDKSKTAGLTRAEVEAINGAAFAKQAGIVFKDVKPSGSAAQTDIVLTAGCHFMLLVSDSGKITAALDYKFGAPKEKPGTDQGSTSTVLVPKSDPPASDSDDGVSKAAVHKSVGPLSLSNIGLQYKNSTIIIVLDATLALGPIGLSLLGFGLGLKLTSSLFSSGISDISIQLRGLAGGLDKPPIIVAGLFEDLSTEKMKLFAGGIAVSFKTYSFLALGSYGVVTTPSGDFKTLFLFAQLSGPLVELEFATINGVSLGFGYNSHVQQPGVDEILNFPLVKGISSQSADAASSSSNVLDILSDDVFTKWVTPQNGSFWFAVGLEVLAFEVLDVRAVGIIEIDPYVSLGLFADAMLSLPPMVPRAECYLYVELGITCRVDIRYGSFSVEGKLSPNSFIFRPSCHLLGGFALYYWFDPSPYAGDFVFTVGGYHPAYKPPTYYPRPQRLTIRWQLDSSISITGESFFAITPKVCMGGGSLSVLFQLGALRAHLDAYVSFLMMWNPFHFVGDIGVSVGVGYHGRFLFWTYNIEIDISALLHLEGPPFGGKVHVNFWLFGFDIYFGSHPGPPPPLSLEEFWTLLSRSSNQPNTGHNTGITLVVEFGYAQGKRKEVTPVPGQPWILNTGKFRFNIQCRFALHTVKYNSESTWVDVCNSKVPIYSKPMHTTESMESVLKITILDKETSQDVGGFTFLELKKNVPSAMWGRYNSTNDPSRGASPADLLDGNNSTIKDMLTGIHVISPSPEYPDDHIPPFNAHDAMFVEIINDEHFPTANSSSQAKAWVPKTTDWKGAENAWSSPAEVAKNVAAEFGKAFGWIDKLVGSPPTLLIDKFEDVYLSIPGITSL